MAPEVFHGRDKARELTSLSPRLTHVCDEITATSFGTVFAQFERMSADIVIGRPWPAAFTRPPPAPSVSL